MEQMTTKMMVKIMRIAMIKLMTIVKIVKQALKQKQCIQRTM